MSRAAWLAITAAALIGLFVVLNRMFEYLTWASVVVLMCGAVFAVLVVVATYAIARERWVWWALLWDAGARGFEARATRAEAQGEADYAYTQRRDRQYRRLRRAFAAARYRVRRAERELKLTTIAVRQLREENEALIKRFGQRKEDRPS
jgi:hypothetical protein